MLRLALHRPYAPLATLRIMALRVMILMIMLISFGGQLLLTAASLPEESPRAALLRLTGIDIAPVPTQHLTAHRAITSPPAASPDIPPNEARDSACPHSISATTQRAAPSHHLSHRMLKDAALSLHHTPHHTHHHGADCPLCPFLTHIIFALICLIYSLGYRQQKRRLWQQAPPAHAPPHPYQQRPPSRGPPLSIHALYAH